MNKAKFVIFTVFALFLSFLCTLLTEDYNRYYEAQEVYRVYLDGHSVGLVKSKEELEKYIDNEQESIKEKYNVNKVYIPDGLEIKKETTYSSSIDTAQLVYEKIKDSEAFTIEGYIITITGNKQIDDETADEIKKVETKANIYVLNKEVFDNAISQTILAFVDKDNYNSYLAETQQTAEDGKEWFNIDDIYLKENVTIKKGYISTNEDIYTDSKSLATYLLFGVSDSLKTYTVKSGDTVAKIADNNKLSVNEFLIANKDISSENTLLYVGKEVVVDTIKPIITIVEETKESVLQEKNYKTEIQEDPSFYVGYSQVIQNGVAGQELITRTKKIENGKAVDVVTINTVETKTPINRIVKTGNKTQFAVGNTGIWAWPTRSGYVISTYFGHDNSLGYYRYHAAIDITGTGCGSPIYAANDGTVTAATSHPSLGNYIMINHNNGYTTTYAHLTRYYVQKGQAVSMGDVIGTMGTTGYSFGCHLHYVTTYNGVAFNPFNLY